MNTGDPPGPGGAPRRHATVLESVEDIRAQIRNAAKQAQGGGVGGAGVGVGAAATAPEPASDTLSFRPRLRPPMAILCALDDGDDSGELFRVRAGSFLIGRVEGNLVISHDSGISGRHAEISRRLENGEHAWYLKDLQSTNGTFVRAANVVLNHEQELLIGSRRFRFEAIAPPPEPTQVAAPNATRKWEAIGSASALTAAQPALVDISQGGDARRFPLTGQEQWLGRDPRQSSIVVDDPMIDRKHARIFRDAKNRWVIANERSVNGIWARIQEVGLGRGGYFQCGEQRFFFKPF